MYYLLHATMLCTWYVLIHIYGETHVEQVF